MFKVILSFFGILIFTLISVLCNETPRISLKQGVLSGKVEKSFFKKQNFYAFKGVPYAKPPVEELRFLPPLEHEGWNGIYEAHSNKPTCLQFNTRIGTNELPGISGSEDCLYLSIFTPNLEGSAPVVVFDYNNKFKTGFNGTDTYSPEFFVEENVIVVTITYRLGLFGYLTTEDGTVPSNAGLKDFILGLQWIQNNIKEFGGDPERVTLMGNRGGATLVEILLYSEKAKGLFNSAIIQSGTAMETSYFSNNPQQMTKNLIEVLEITTENNDTKSILKELQKLDSTKLLENELKVIDDALNINRNNIFAFAPTIENKGPDAVLTVVPENGNIVNDVPVMIGFNSREGLEIAADIIYHPVLVNEITSNYGGQLPIRSTFKLDKNSSLYDQAAEEVVSFYLKDGYLHFENILEYAVYLGDVAQNYALNVATKKLASEMKSHVFYYMFDYKGSLNENSEFISRRARSSLEHWGATVGDELCYLHLCSRIRRNYELFDKLISIQPELKVLKKMVRLWTNFIKTGNPTPDSQDEILKGFRWEPINKESKNANYLHITKLLRMSENPLGERANFWDGFLEKYSQLVRESKDVERDEL